MTDTEYSKLSDRELDALVAEKVAPGFAFICPKCGNSDEWGGHTREDGSLVCQCHECRWSGAPGACPPRPFSTDIGAAWSVVEKITSDGRRGLRLWLGRESTLAEFHWCLSSKLSPIEIKGNLPARAICLAALKALQSQKGD